MESIIFQNLDKNLIYYGVYGAESESWDGSDILSAVRKRFFETGAKQKGRGNLKTDTELYNYSYVMEDGVSLRYRKLKKDGRQLERVFDTAGGYYVETLNDRHKPVKRAFFDKRHRWLKTEFLAPEDKRILSEVFPSTEKEQPVLLLKTPHDTETLVPFNVSLDHELTEKLNIMTSEPPVFCMTSKGSFYFCSKSEYERRKKALEQMMEEEEPETLGTGRSSFIVDASKLEEEKPAFDLSGSEAIYLSEEEETVQPPAVEEEVFVPAEVPEEEEAAAEPETAIIERAEEGVPYERQCTFAGECPYETLDKQQIESGGVRYFYFGDLKDNRRHGRGRTAMKNGETAYEGQYACDKRDGFGVYYYKSGKLCYAGGWKDNQRSGLGVTFSPTDGSAFIGEWKGNRSMNVGATFDRKGKLLYVGNVDHEQKHGAGITYNEEDKTFFVGKYKDGEFLCTGTQFSSEGDLLYTGEYKDNRRTGTGTSYRADGTVHYQGQWANSLYSGEGTLYLENGGTLKGAFRRGKAYGKGTLTDHDGKVIYEGSFVDDVYNGTGKLFSDDGGYAEGRFVDGEPTGIFNEYNAEKKLIYSGEWTDMHRNGQGIAYQDGEKIYEGEFRNSLYHGEGKLMENGSAVYIGTFSDGKRNGYGVEFKNNEMYYQGMWENDCYHGSGILYEDGEARFVGMFKNGRRDGRINEIAEHKIIRKCLYEADVLTYMCEYDGNGMPVYYGSVSNGMRNGMGCTFVASCEKQFEGIFRNNAPEKAMKVFLKELPELPVCSRLDDTAYKLYRKTPEFIIEKPLPIGTAQGIYTGRLKDGLPDGAGTVLYSDHRYTGMFAEGLPEGEGILYMHDGTERKGKFSAKPFAGCQTLILQDMTYYFEQMGVSA